ncbi:retropepsin-like aspartic protease [Zeaxanthinibacter sp. PT1]|nr:retropepsin-like aspartic protease [Zeaxanthinibacter sp. PT1]MDC6350222.1 retropepsin-like aspartic protease [Zeaxanthinibacter sp. PT1]
MPSLKKFLKSKKYLQVPMKLTSTNHLEVKAEINGNPGRFILDTGASSTCVGIEQAERFELVSEHSDIMAAGAGASDLATRISEKNSICLGKWKDRKAQIVILDLMHVNQALLLHEAEEVDGIIGADLLETGRAVIDYHKKILYLRKK